MSSKSTSRKKQLKPPRIFTIGHSSHTMADFLRMLEAYKLKLVVDVRTIPKSRHNPQFGQARLRNSLRRHGIEYRHMVGLGGLRRPLKTSVNAAWRNAAFRGFADYMQTPDFRKNLERLIALSKRKRFSIMCAEAVPWRCHRSLIADALLARGLAVRDIMSPTQARDHHMTSFAQVRAGRVVYPIEDLAPKMHPF